MDRSPADARASEIVTDMTIDEKIQLVTGYMGLPEGAFDGGDERDPLFDAPPSMTPPPGAVGSDGFVPGIPRLGVPDLQLAGAGVGITALWPRRGGETVSFPSSLAQTATWDPSLIREFGQRLGDEARAQGINVVLAGAVNLTIEPRSGRNFEYHGEDPVLAGTIVREELLGTQDRGVVASIKHYAANFQETGRFVVNSVIDERALREGELLGFEIALVGNDIGAVMTSYNKVNGLYSSENPYLLTTVLKEEWQFKGWVMSDWGATHSTVASALAGMDQEFPHNHWYGQALKAAVTNGQVPMSRLDDMNHRILRSLIVAGLLDTKPVRQTADVEANLRTAQRIEEEGAVLLKNDDALPLPNATLTIAVIGANADLAVPSGGGSAAVRPIGGDPVAHNPFELPLYWLPSSPVRAIRDEFPQAEVLFAGADDLEAAQQVAAASNVVVVFAHQLTTESLDLPDLSLPEGQDELIRTVAAAAPTTVVVLQTGGVVTMPWLDDVDAVLAAWYPGHRGAEAIARILSGAVNPSGRTPVSWPRVEQDLPHRTVFPMPLLPGQTEPPKLSLVGLITQQQGEYFDATYDEGLLLGYKWYQDKGIVEAFPFGHGLSYTTFEYGEISARWIDEGAEVRLSVSNVGPVDGCETVQVYASLPDGTGSPRRLVGWAKVNLKAGGREPVTVTVPSKYLSFWSVDQQSWVLPRGRFLIDAAASSRDVRARVTLDR